MPDRISLQSIDPNFDRSNQLASLFPEAVSDGKIDFEKLKAVLLGSAETERERFGLSWAGKSEAVRAVRYPSLGTLKPCREESVDFDATGNMIIEGDNLEVLRLLQQSYFGKIKMIYIDPPYNTGNDFIYPDNFRDGLHDYLVYTGQLENGSRTTTNGDSSGRFHSRWLSMMYPRLFLSKNLLRDDGLIFASIDEHEAHHLRSVMDEVFGEESRVATLIWKRRINVDSRSKSGVSDDHEYVLVYGRGGQPNLRGQDIDLAKYKNPDNDPRGPWASDNLLGLATKDQRPNLHYDLVDPASGIVYPCAETGWRYSRETMARLIAAGKIMWPASAGGRPRLKRFQGELSDELTGLSSLLDTAANVRGTKELMDLFDGRVVMDFPKPTDLLRLLVRQSNSYRDSVVLDFFAGSGTTAQAVLEQNREDGGDRKFILVQIPEPSGNDQYATISEVTKERVRRVIAKITADAGNELDLGDGARPDLGFKVFKLSESNFKIWDSDAAGELSPDELAAQLTAFADNLKPDAKEEDILFEVLLKGGYELTADRERIATAHGALYLVDDRNVAVFVGEAIEAADVRLVVQMKPKTFICLDAAFHGSDELLTNTELQTRDAGIVFRTI
jgi:adenine-specific DNA-methyltransferase